MNKNIIIDGIDGIFEILNHRTDVCVVGERKGYIETYTLLHTKKDDSSNAFVLSYIGDEETSLTPREIINMAANNGMIKARQFVIKKMNKESGIRLIYTVLPNKVMLATGRSTDINDYDIETFDQYLNDDDSWGILSDYGEQKIMNFSDNPDK